MAQGCRLSPTLEPQHKSLFRALALVARIRYTHHCTFKPEPSTYRKIERRKIDKTAKEAPDTYDSLLGYLCVAVVAVVVTALVSRFQWNLSKTILFKKVNRDLSKIILKKMLNHMSQVGPLDE